MNAREGRMVVIGMVLGAALGGVAVWIMRTQEARRLRGQSDELANVKAVANAIRWQDVLNIGVAGIALARQIASLSERVEEEAAKS